MTDNETDRRVDNETDRRKTRNDIISISIALIALNAMLAPLLRSLISEPSDSAYLLFRLVAGFLALFNAAVIATLVRKARKTK